MRKYKILIICFICFLLVTSVALPLFAMDIVGDGSSSPPPYLYSVIPIESMYVKSMYGGGTSDLDNFVINCGGYLEWGQSTGGAYECYYGNNKTVYVETSLSRINQSSGNWFISQTVQPKYDLFNNNSAVQIVLEINPFFLTTDYLNTISLTCTSDGNASFGNVLYSYDYIKVTENGTLSSDTLGWTMDFETASGTYTQSPSGSNSTSLFPQTFYNSVRNNVLSHLTAGVGSYDGLTLQYDNADIYITRLTITVNVTYTGTLTNKSFSLEAPYTTTRNINPHDSFFALYGTIDRDVTIETADFDLSAFGQFLGDTVGGFMNTQIFGTVTFGVLVYIIIGIGLLMWALKVFMGG